MKAYVIGIDYGTDSARAVLIDAMTGGQVASSSMNYPRWAKGLYCDPSIQQFRQHPLDYVECLEHILRNVVAECPDPSAIKAIAVDTTASTPCFCDENAVPLSMKPGFEDDPDAMFILWKDHTGTEEADYITAKCRQHEPDYTCLSGGNYSPENFWSKVLHTVRKSEKVRNEAYGLIEECDFIPAVLTGCRSHKDLKPGHCVASVKQFWCKEWGGFPQESFFEDLDPLLVPFRRTMVETNYPASYPAGHLCAEWAARTGLSEDVIVASGNVDGHSGAVGTGVKEGTVSMTLGTSSCYMAVKEYDGHHIEGLFGQAEGAILEGLDGIEAGMSAFGDIFAWFRKLLCWPLDNVLDTSDPAVAAAAGAAKEAMLVRLTQEAERIPLSEGLPYATDFFNGRRSPAPNNTITATIARLKITSSAPEVFRALVEAAAFGTKAIIDHLEANGVPTDHLVACGGIAQKSPFVMQVIADVLGHRMEVSDSKDSCALGAAVHAAVAAGLYPDVPSAQRGICPPVCAVYEPDMEKHAVYMKRYALYQAMSAHTGK